MDDNKKKTSILGTPNPKISPELKALKSIKGVYKQLRV